VPYPSLVANAAIFTVEEAALLVRISYRSSMRRQAEQVIRDPGASADAKRQAHRSMIDHEDSTEFLYETADLAVRSGASVVLEIALAGTGTFLAPGCGTWLGQMVGSTLAWVF
jgi:hypothetical protein